jgi:hypothetical protein
MNKVKTKALLVGRAADVDDMKQYLLTKGIKEEEIIVLKFDKQWSNK